MKKAFLLIVVFAAVAFAVTFVFHRVNQSAISYSKGHRLFVNKLYAQSLPYFNAAVSARPNFRNALRERALAALWTGQYDVARESFEMLDRIDRGNRFSKRGLADIDAFTGQRARAIETYKELLKDDPDDAYTGLSLADAYFWNGDYSEAAPLYRAFLKRHPMHEQALVGLAASLSAVGENEEAAALFSKLERDYPYSTTVLNSIAAYYMRTADYPRAVEYYDRVLKIDGDNLEAVMRKVECLSALKDWDAAIAAIEVPARERPNDLLLQMLLGNVELWAKKYPDAEATFKALYEKWPDDQGVNAGLARLYAWQGNFKQAMPYLQKLAAGAREPDVELYRMLAEAYMSAGDIAKASFYSKEVLKADPSDINARMNLANVAMRGRRFAEAEALLRGIVSENPSNRQARGKLADVLMYQGKFAEAEREYKILLGR